MFIIAALFIVLIRNRQSFVHAGVLPPEMHAGKKQDRTDNIEGHSLKYTLCERHSSCDKENKREYEAGSGPVFIRNAPGCFHTGINGGLRDIFF
jgi:hypothetical protein